MSELRFRARQSGSIGPWPLRLVASLYANLLCLRWWFTSNLVNLPQTDSLPLPRPALASQTCALRISGSVTSTHMGSQELSLASAGPCTPHMETHTSLYPSDPSGLSKVLTCLRSVYVLPIHRQQPVPSPSLPAWAVAGVSSPPLGSLLAPPVHLVWSLHAHLLFPQPLMALSNPRKVLEAEE